MIIFDFLKENLAMIALVVSFGSLCVAYKAYKINKTKLNIDIFDKTIKFLSDIEELNKIRSMYDRLNVKKFDDIILSNIQEDLPILESIKNRIKEKEDKLQQAYVFPTNITEWQNHLSELIELITATIKNNAITSDIKGDLAVQYSNLYLEVFLIYPEFQPKYYQETNDEKSKHKRFMDYYSDMMPKVKPFDKKLINDLLTLTEKIKLMQSVNIK